MSERPHARFDGPDGPRKTDAPLAWVVEQWPLIRPGGHVLDVACGNGRHLRAALDAGFRVTGIDRDLAGVGDLGGRPGIRLIETDLETGAAPPFAAERFDGVVVTNYLWRPLLAAIVAAVADDGVLIYETFAAGNERYGRPARPEFLLQPGELIAAVTGTLVVIAYRHGRRDEPHRSVRQGIVAIGPHHAALV